LHAGFDEEEGVSENGCKARGVSRVQEKTKGKRARTTDDTGTSSRRNTGPSVSFVSFVADEGVDVLSERLEETESGTVEGDLVGVLCKVEVSSSKAREATNQRKEREKRTNGGAQPSLNPSETLVRPGLPQAVHCTRVDLAVRPCLQSRRDFDRRSTRNRDFGAWGEVRTPLKLPIKLHTSLRDLHRVGDCVGRAISAGARAGEGCGLAGGKGGGEGGV
jgi:hypothetical protein